MGKLFKGIGKVVKGIGKGIKGVVKGIAKGVKKVGKGIMKGLGKLGPIGTIALSFVLPGIGAALGAMWSSAAGALAGSGSTFLQAVGGGMQWAAKAASTIGGAIKTGYQTITSKITDGLNYIGGGIKEGASNLWNAATEVVGGGKPLTNVTNIGQTVGETAMSYSPSAGTNSIFQAGQSTSGLQLPSSPMAIEAATPSIQASTELFKPAVNALQSPTTPSLLTQATQKAVTSPMPKRAMTGMDYAKKAAEFGADALGNMSQESAGGGSIRSYDPSMDIAQRGGVGGVGAAGGTFLSEAQRMQQQLLEQQIKQLG